MDGTVKVFRNGSKVYEGKAFDCIPNARPAFPYISFRDGPLDQNPKPKWWAFGGISVEWEFEGEDIPEKTGQE